MIKRVSHLEIGKLGEQLAAKYLRAKGYKLYAKNWKCRVGEIDLISIDNDKLVFVEVKTRLYSCLLYTSPSPRDRQKSRMPSSA